MTCCRWSYLVLITLLLVYKGNCSKDDCDDIHSCNECAIRQDCGWCDDECWDILDRDKCLLHHQFDMIDETPGCNDNDPITVIGFDENEKLIYKMDLLLCETIEVNNTNDTNCDQEISTTTIWIKSADIETMSFQIFAKLNHILTSSADDDELEEYLSSETTESWPPCLIHVRYGYLSSLSCPNIDEFIQDKNRDNSSNGTVPSKPGRDFSDEEVEAFIVDYEYNEPINYADKAFETSSGNKSITRIVEDLLLRQFYELLPRVDSALYDEEKEDISELDVNGRTKYQRNASKTDDGVTVLHKCNDLDKYDEWKHDYSPSNLNIDEVTEVDDKTHHIKHTKFHEDVGLKSDPQYPSQYNSLDLDVDLIDTDIVSDDYIHYLEEWYEYSMSKYLYEIKYFTLAEWREAKSNAGYDEFSWDDVDTDVEYDSSDEFFEEQKAALRRRLAADNDFDVMDAMTMWDSGDIILGTQSLLGIVTIVETLRFTIDVGVDWVIPQARSKSVHELLVADAVSNEGCPFKLRESYPNEFSNYKHELNQCCKTWKYNYGICTKSKQDADNDLRSCIAHYTSSTVANAFKSFAETENVWLNHYSPIKWKYCDLVYPQNEEKGVKSPIFITAYVAMKVNGHKIIEIPIPVFDDFGDAVEKRKDFRLWDMWIPTPIPGLLVRITFDFYLRGGIESIFKINTPTDGAQFGVEPFIAAGVVAEAYVTLLELARAGVTVTGELVKVSYPSRVIFHNLLRNDAPKYHWQYPKYAVYLIEQKVVTVAVTASLWYEHYWFKLPGCCCASCSCSWSGCSCSIRCWFFQWGWSGRKYLWRQRLLSGTTRVYEKYKKHDGIHNGDKVNKVNAVLQVYSKHEMSNNELDIHAALDALDVNDDEYDSKYQYQVILKEDRTLISNVSNSSNATRRLQQVINPEYDYVYELDLNLIVFDPNQANVVSDEINNGALNELEAFDDTIMNIEENGVIEEEFIEPTPKPTLAPTPSPIGEEYATIEVQCDNELEVYYSQDGVTDFELILSGDSEFEYVFGLAQRPCDESKLLFECIYDSGLDGLNGNGEGGFIANIEYNNFTYPTNINKYATYYTVLNASIFINDINESVDGEEIDLENLELHIQNLKLHDISNNESLWIWPDFSDFVDNETNNTDIQFIVWFEFAFRATDADECPLANCTEKLGGIKHDWDWNKIGHNPPEYNIIDFSVNTGVGTLTIDIELDYIGYSSAGFWKSEFGFGSTYVFDFESFGAEYSKINEPGTCSNRWSWYYDGVAFDKWWIYSYSPYGVGHLGNTKYLSYPPPGDYWNIASMDEHNELSQIGCNKIHYFATFRWNDLLSCSNYYNNISYITINNDENWINMSGTLYVNLVSPISKEFNLNSYRVYQLISLPFIIAIKKAVNLISLTGIALFQLTFISIYKENHANNLRLTLLTQSQDYLVLDDIFLYSYPTATQQAIKQSNITGFEIPDTSNDVTALFNNSCINAINGICLQIWEIRLDDAPCPLDLSGNYIFSFLTICNDEVDLSDREYCENWKESNPKYNVINMETLFNWNDEVCETKTFYAYFDGEIKFYVDNEYLIENNENGLYLQNKDRIYVQVRTIFIGNNSWMYTTELNNVWLCSTDYLDDHLSIDSQINVQDSGCFSPNIDNDNGYAPYHIIQNGHKLNHSLTHEIVHQAEGDQHVRFSFICPDTVTRDRLYIHVQLQLKISIDEEIFLNNDSNTNITQRRRRLREMKKSNYIRHFGDNIGITNNPDLSIKYNDNDNDNYINESYPYFTVIMICLFIIIMFISIIIIIFILIKKRRNKDKVYFDEKLRENEENELNDSSTDID